MTRKLLVVTYGTFVADIGLKIRKQLADRHDGEGLVCFIDTIDLASDKPDIHQSERLWLQVSPDQIESIHSTLAVDSPEAKALYKEFRPSPSSLGAANIRYYGASVAFLNRGRIRKWLGEKMTTLVERGDREKTIRVVVIVSAVGATGSGSLEHLTEAICGAARDAGLSIPIDLDRLILHPGMTGITNLQLANTFALHAEQAALELEEQASKMYQGRTMLVGWGDQHALKSKEEVQEVTATLVRVLHDPTSEMSAKYWQEWVNQHALLDIDTRSHLPSNLSLATPVTIGFGNCLEKQFIQRDTAQLITNLIWGDKAIDSAEVLLSSLEKYMAGDSSEDRYRKLLNMLSEDVELTVKRSDFNRRIDRLLPKEQASHLERSCAGDIQRIQQSRLAIRTKGERLVDMLLAELQKKQRERMIEPGNSNVSLFSLLKDYQKLQEVLTSMLEMAMTQQTRITPGYEPVKKVLRDWKETPTRTWLGGAERWQRTAHAAKDAVINYLLDLVEEQASPVAISVLEELLSHCDGEISRLSAALNRLERWYPKDEGRAGAEPSFSPGQSHLLHIAALDEKEMDTLYQQVSIFTPRTRKRGFVSARPPAEDDQLAEFRLWLSEQGKIDDLFKGDPTLLARDAEAFTGDRIHHEMLKHSVLEVLLQGNTGYDEGGMLQKRLRKALELASPLVAFTKDFVSPEIKGVVWVSAYWRNDEQQAALKRAINDTFGTSCDDLCKSEDPTEIVVLYHMDGLSMTALNDMRGRVFDAFLEQREEFHKIQLLASNGNRRERPIQRPSKLIYSSPVAQERVERTDIVCRIHHMSMGGQKRDASRYHELRRCNQCEADDALSIELGVGSEHYVPQTPQFSQNNVGIGHNERG